MPGVACGRRTQPFLRVRRESAGERCRFTLLSIGGSGIRTEMLVGRHGEVSSWPRQVLPALPCARDLHRLGPGSVIVAVTGPHFLRMCGRI